MPVISLRTWQPTNPRWLDSSSSSSPDRQVVQTGLHQSRWVRREDQADPGRPAGFSNRSSSSCQKASSEGCQGSRISRRWLVQWAC